MDAAVYHNEAIIMASKSLKNSIEYFLASWTFSDLGAVMLVSSLYRLVESNLIVNFFNIFIGLTTAFGIYRISRLFMINKYAFICSLSYSLASFVLWFHSSGLKESFMIMLIVLFFDRYYQFLNKRKIWDIVLATLFSLSLLLFRPALMFFCFGSVGIAALISKRRGIIGTISLIIFIVVIISFYPMLNSLFNQFTYGGDIESMIAGKESEGMIQGGVIFTYFVNFFSQSIGPLPTVSPDFKTLLSIYTPGLIFRVLLSVPFWLGIYFLVMKKANIVNPLALFALIEMSSLPFIFEGLELRKSLPHFPMIFIISFWFLDKYDLTPLFRRNLLVKRIIYFSTPILLGIIIFWNLRYM